MLPNGGGVERQGNFHLVDSVKVAVLGVGDLTLGPLVLASLALYFGERPLEIHLQDDREEIVDLFDLLARQMCFALKSQHLILATTDVAESVDDADVVLSTSEAISAKMDVSAVLSIGMWPLATEHPFEEIQVPLQILRWIRGEDSMYPLFCKAQGSTIRTILDMTVRR